MTDAELRLECLKLALAEVPVPGSEPLARAGAFARFVVDGNSQSTWHALEAGLPKKDDADA